MYHFIHMCDKFSLYFTIKCEKSYTIFPFSTKTGKDSVPFNSL